MYHKLSKKQEGKNEWKNDIELSDEHFNEKWKAEKNINSENIFLLLLLFDVSGVCHAYIVRVYRCIYNA